MMVMCGVIYPILLINLLHGQFVFLETNIDQQGDIDILPQKQQDRVNVSRCGTTIKNTYEGERFIYNTTEKQQYNTIQKRIEKIKDHCGQLCDIEYPINLTNVDVKAFQIGYQMQGENFYYSFPKKHVSCYALWNNSIFDEPNKFQRTLQIIPNYLKKYFSYNNQVPINPYYFDNLVEEERATDGANWGKSSIMDIIRTAI